MNVGGIPNGLGTLFSTKVNGTITHVRLYTSALETGVHYVALWDYETRTLVSDAIYESAPPPKGLKVGKSLNFPPLLLLPPALNM